MNSSGLGLFDSGQFQQMNAIATVLAQSSLLPEHLRGFWKEKPNRDNGWKGDWEDHPLDVRVANAMLVVNAARLWKCDPFQLATHSYVVGGKLDFDGQVYAALVNHHGNLSVPLTATYVGDGESRVAKITGQLAHEAEPREIEIAVIAARTTDRKGNVNAQWTKDIDQMLFYAGARKWVRRHCPQVLLGLVAVSEQETLSDDRPNRPPAIEAAARPAIAEMPESQRLLTEAAPSQDYNRMLAEVRDASNGRALERIVMDAKGSRDMTQAERDEVVQAARARWSQVPSEPGDAGLSPPKEASGDKPSGDQLQADTREVSEAYGRWERTLKTETETGQIANHMATIDGDDGLSDDEKESLAVIANDLIRNMEMSA